MYSKRITFTIAELNGAAASGTEQSLIKEIPVRFRDKETFTGNTEEGLLRKYPRQLQIINTCGADIEFICLQGATERSYFDENYAEADFGWVPVLDNTTFTFSPMPKSDTLIVRKSSGTADADLIATGFPLIGNDVV